MIGDPPPSLLPAEKGFAPGSILATARHQPCASPDVARHQPYAAPGVISYHRERTGSQPKRQPKSMRLISRFFHSFHFPREQLGDGTSTAERRPSLTDLTARRRPLLTRSTTGYHPLLAGTLTGTAAIASPELAGWRGGKCHGSWLGRPRPSGPRPPSLGYTPGSS